MQNYCYAEIFIFIVSAKFLNFFPPWNGLLFVAEIPAGFGKGSKKPRAVTNVLVGSTVILHCNPTGSPKPSVSWKKGLVSIQSRGRYRVLANGNLEIINVTTRDNGRFTCEVTNRLGSDSRSGKLVVHST